VIFIREKSLSSDVLHHMIPTRLWIFCCCFLQCLHANWRPHGAGTKVIKLDISVSH